MRSNRALGWINRWTSLVILIGLLMTAGCGQPTTTPTSTSVPPTPTPPPVPLHPAIVEVSPLPGTEMSSQLRWTLVFSEAMNRASVESALAIEPATAGKFDWTDDLTVTFIPDQPLDALSDYQITLGTGAQTQAGLNLVEEWSALYPGAIALRVTDWLPKPDMDEVASDTAIVATFNAPVVALGEDADPSLVGFSIDPPVAGRGEWLNTSTYIYYPENGLPGGKTFTVSVNPDLKSTQGTALTAGVNQWVFHTTMPKVLEYSPTREEIWLDDVIQVTFNEPMDQASLEQGWTLTDGSGNVITGAFKWEDKNRKVTFTPTNLLQRNAVLTLNIPGQTKSQGGTPLGQDFSVPFFTVPDLAMINPAPGVLQSFEPYEGFGWMQLTFSAPINPDDAKNKIKISPPVSNLSVSSYDEQVYISGVFESSTVYTMTYPAGTRDKWGGAAKTEQKAQFRSTDLLPSINIPMMYYSSRTLFLTPQSASIAARAVATDRVIMERAAISFNDLLWINQQYSNTLHGFVPEGVTSWGQALPAAGTVRKDVALNLSDDKKPLSPGIYYFKYRLPNAAASSDSWSTYPDYFTAVVSKVHMTMKVSQTQLFAWAVDLESNTPVQSADVRFYESEGALIGQCITNQDGTCTVDNLALGDGYDYDDYYAIMGEPGDALFSLVRSSWKDGVSPYDFGVSGTEAPSFYLYTDRPIYQPGQTVNFRVVARKPTNNGYSLTEYDALGIKVLAPYSEVNQRQDEMLAMSLPVSDIQTATGSFTLPNNAPIGQYTISIDQEQYSWHMFSVAEYRKPEMALDIAFVGDVVENGGNVDATVTAAYYFGAPVSDLVINWSLFAKNDWYWQKGGYETGKEDDRWQQGYLWSMWYDPHGTYLLSGSGVTGADGKLTISIPLDTLPEGYDPQMLQTFSLLVNAQEEGGAYLSSEAEISYHPEAFTLGVKASAWGAASGTPITFDIQALDWNEKARSGVPITARFEKVRWELKDYDRYTGMAIYTEVVSEGSTTSITTGSQGTTQLVQIPSEPGTWRLTVSSGNAVTEYLTWVGGAGAAGWINMPNQHIEITADQASYKPGETAELFIPNPLAGSGLALVSIERQSVLRTQLVRLEGSQVMVEIPLSATDAPNVYATITLLGQENGKPTFRMGVINLTVEPTEQIFNVEITADPETAGPGDEVTFTLKATDSQGKGVAGEFSMSLVDKAVLALADATERGIAETFYGNRILHVFTSLSLAAYSERLTYHADLGGGGGGDGSIFGDSVRSRFEDSAFWTGTLETDANGIAEVIIRLPDNLTTWVADVRGITADTRIGAATLELTSSKPLLIRPQLPRFVVAGDMLTVNAIVNNNTSQAVTASVDVNLNGAELAAGETLVKSVQVAANGRAVVSWKVKVLAADAFRTRFSATAGELKDAVQPPAVPIKKYTAPYTYATGGILTGQGSHTEVVGLPKSYQPLGGELMVEVSPSLAAAVFAGLEALQNDPLSDYPDSLVSQLLPTLAILQAVTDLGISPPSPVSDYQAQVTDIIGKLQRLQSADGGWAWNAGNAANTHLTAYILYGLSRAEKAGFAVTPMVIQNAVTFLRAQLISPEMLTSDSELDEQAFLALVLAEAGQAGLNTAALMSVRQRLSPWAKACLALAMHNMDANNNSIPTLLSDLESSAQRTATGAFWTTEQAPDRMWATPNYTTAMVTHALAVLDPASTVIPDAARFLSMNRSASGWWNSSYETAWVLTALSEVMKGTGELASQYDYSVKVNGTNMVTGSAQGGLSLTSTQATLPIDRLYQTAGNALEFGRTGSGGRLYYRAFLNLFRSAGDAPSVSKGMTLSRRYTAIGEGCTSESCPSIEGMQVGTGGAMVRLTLTVPQEMYFVVIEDVPPAGVEIFNPGLKTNAGLTLEPADPANPFDQGWGNWWFSRAEIHDDLVRWTAEYLPAGTYELVYTVTPFTEGEFQVLPARAWQIYFPEVQATSSGGIFTVSK